MAFYQSPVIEVEITPSIPVPSGGIYEYWEGSEEVERKMLESEVNSMFTDEEQAVLWKCLNDKVEDWVNRGLDKVIRRRMTTVTPEMLYRGVNRRMLNVLQNVEVGEVFTSERVVSFSTDFNTARSFASFGCYGTKTIIRWSNPTIAYNYQEDMLKILAAAPNCEFSAAPYDPLAKIDRKNKINMVQDEQEWMIANRNEVPSN
ncbi:RNA polymerase ADP-ribosylase [Enterobacter phage CC31]|uniref:RNA polymerase ADP-ribosylase n=1 Tax=Enterobacter phage CC31 TaxID=709484 RepID=E5DI31_9CAUD|nr:RNA polymerase ADP-ribosylase [Enterobacter phage CC31]ADB81516.1 RNA polymerase ADP-ribosylase [Enterobacter phage CC31]